MKRNASFLLFLSIILLYYGISGLVRDFGRNSTYTIEAQGKIIDIHEKAPSKGAALHPVIAFTDEAGNEIVFTSKAGSASYGDKIGETVTIQYPEGFPEEAWVKASAAGGISPVVLLLSGTVFFVFWFSDTYIKSSKGDGLPSK